MLFGGDTNGVIKEKICKERIQEPMQLNSGSPLMAMTMQKRAEDSGLSRLGVKSQAYVGRNSSKPCKDSANVTSVASTVISAIASERNLRCKSCNQGKTR